MPKFLTLNLRGLKIIAKSISRMSQSGKFIKAKALFPFPFDWMLTPLSH